MIMSLACMCVLNISSKEILICSLCIIFFFTHPLVLLLCISLPNFENSLPLNDLVADKFDGKTT